VLEGRVVVGQNGYVFHPDEVEGVARLVPLQLGGRMQVATGTEDLGDERSLTLHTKRADRLEVVAEHKPALGPPRGGRSPASSLGLRRLGHHGLVDPRSVGTLSPLGARPFGSVVRRLRATACLPEGGVDGHHVQKHFHSVNVHDLGTRLDRPVLDGVGPPPVRMRPLQAGFVGAIRVDQVLDGVVGEALGHAPDVLVCGILDLERPLPLEAADVPPVEAEVGHTRLVVPHPLVREVVRRPGRSVDPLDLHPLRLSGQHPELVASMAPLDRHFALEEWVAFLRRCRLLRRLLGIG